MGKKSAAALRSSLILLIFLIDRTNPFLAAVVCLILVLRCGFLCDAVEFIVVLLLLELCLRFFVCCIHFITSEPVCAKAGKLYIICF